MNAPTLQNMIRMRISMKNKRNKKKNKIAAAAYRMRNNALHYQIHTTNANYCEKKSVTISIDFSLRFPQYKSYKCEMHKFHQINKFQLTHKMSNICSRGPAIFIR